MSKYSYYCPLDLLLHSCLTGFNLIRSLSGDHAITMQQLNDPKEVKVFCFIGIIWKTMAIIPNKPPGANVSHRIKTFSI